MASRCILLPCFVMYMTLCYGIKAQNCRVDSFSAQAGFDFAKFMGKWYEISWYSDTASLGSADRTDNTQSYVPTSTTTATVYARERITQTPTQCQSSLYTLSTTKTPGKMRFSANGVATPYWVLETDYRQYAFVYGCYNVFSNGTCGGARVWILSRTPTLPNKVNSRIPAFFQNICIQMTSLQSVTQNKECSVRTHWKTADDQDCTVSKFAVQEDFDIERYAGTWYETRWLAPFSIHANELFMDYQHRYVITEDGNMTGYVYGRSPDKPDQCFYNDVKLLKTPTPGKLLYKTKTEAAIPYWVLKTDYTQFAVVYGCYNVSSDGSCYEARSWVWSRTPTLPKLLEYEINVFLQKICVNPSSYLSTEQKKLCPLKPMWKLDSGMDCIVNNFEVTSNFDIAKYTGTWYETRWLAPVSIPASDLFQDYQHHYIITGDGNITGYIYGRSPDTPDKCFYNDVSLQVTKTPGKFLFKTSSDPAIPYWVLKTDYTQYAVVYGCYNVSSDGSCHMARSWVWSRTPTLPKPLEYEVNTFLQNICVNPAAYLSTEQNELCPLKPVWNLNNEMDCNVTGFRVKDNFDINMFTSSWYEIRWLPAEYMLLSDMKTDRMIELFTSYEGDLTAYVRDRSLSMCQYTTEMYRKTDSPGRFMVSLSPGESFGYWVADTDYTNYAVLYGCKYIGSDGGCLSARVSIWGRTPTLALQFQYHANSVLQGLCINPSAFVRTTHNNACRPFTIKDCPVDSVSSAAACRSSIFILSASLLSVKLLGINQS